MSVRTIYPKGTPYSSGAKVVGYEPTNCNKVRCSKESDPYKAASKYIERDPKRNCCNVGVDNSVQQWQLPPDKPKVELKKAGSGTTFYYRPDKLLGSDDFY